MKLVLVGAIGAGKGTQAKKLSSKYGIPHISTGDILRENIKNKTEIGLKVKNILDSGGLVPDDITTDLVKIRLSEQDCKNGFILDGFPRTVVQAKALEDITSIDKVIYIKIDDDVIVKRLTGRRTCTDCGSMYNIEYLKPKVADTCDACGSGLVQREDDKEETIKERLKVFHELTAPIISLYENKGLVFEVNGVGDIEEISKTIINALEG